MLHWLHQDTSSRTVIKKRFLFSVSVAHESVHVDQLLTSSLLGYQKDDFHSCFVESQGPSPSGVLWILSDYGLCPLKIAGRWFFLHFHVSCFSRCLAALTVNAGVPAIAHVLYSCSAKVCTCAQWACANSIWQQHAHSIFTSTVWNHRGLRPALLRVSQFPLTVSSRIS